MATFVSLAPDAPQNVEKLSDPSEGEFDYELQEKIVKLISRCEEFKCISHNNSLTSSQSDDGDILMEHREQLLSLKTRGALIQVQQQRQQPKHSEDDGLEVVVKEDDPVALKEANDILNFEVANERQLRMSYEILIKSEMEVAIAKLRNEVTQERHSRIVVEQEVRSLEALVDALRREIQEKEEMASITSLPSNKLQRLENLRLS